MEDEEDERNLLAENDDDMSSDPSYSPHTSQDDYARLSANAQAANLANRFTSNDPTIVKAGLTGSIFVLCASALGAGLLTIPQQFYKIGFFPCIAILLIVALLNFYAIYLLTRAADAGRVENYEDVVELALPGYGSYLLTILLNVGSFGSLVAFLDIIGDILQSIVLFLTPARSFFLDKSFLLLCFTFAFIFPLCMLRNIAMLKYSSFLATMLLSFFVGVVAYWGIEGLVHGSIQFDAVAWGFPMDRKTSLFDRMFQVIPSLILAYACQTNVLPIRRELDTPTVSRMNLINFLTMSLSAFLYITIGCFGYFLDPGSASVSTPENIFGTILRFSFLMVMVFHYPCAHYPMRNSIEVTFFSKYEFSWIRHTMETVFMISATLVVALAIPELSKAFALAGAIAGIPLSFLLPVGCFIRIVYFPNATNCLLKPLPRLTAPSSSEEFENIRTEMINESLPDISRGDKNAPISLWLIPPVLFLLFSVVAWVISLYAVIVYLITG